MRKGDLPIDLVRIFVDSKCTPSYSFFLDFYLTLLLAVYIAMGNDQAASSQPSSVIFLKTGVLVSAGSEIEENVVLPMLLELFFCM